MMNFHKLYVLFFCTLCVFLSSFSQDDCILDGGIVLTPAPTPDPNFTGATTYPPETTVVMCFTVEEYNTPGTQNWMHGIVPLFGPGWDLSTLQPVGQPETQFWAGGEWIWVGDVVAGITGELISPPGWWFDSDGGGGDLDGDPSDNWGDGNNGPWEFCWEITTQSSPPAFNGSNLVVEILNFADSETGSWDNSDALDQCIDDPSFFIQGLELNAPTCDESFLTVVNPTCATEQNGGNAILTPSGLGPFDYLLFNLETGDVVDLWTNQPIDLPIIANNLNPAEYLFQVEDLGFPGGCASPVYFEILSPEQINVEFNIIDASCSDSSDGSIEITSIINENCINESLIPEEIDFTLCPSTEDPVCGCDFIQYFNACHAESFYGVTAYDLGPCPEVNPDYSITWFNNGITIDTDTLISDLFVGEYSVLIECVDNTSPVFGCFFDTLLLLESPPEFIYDFTVNNVSCFIDEDLNGVNDILDGFIEIELVGGTLPYSIALGLENGTILDSQNGSSVIFNNLGVGDYYFFPLDANGCLVFEQEVFFSVSEPEPLIIDSFVLSNYNGFEISCNSGQDGFINLNISGGTAPYSYSWSNNSSNQNLTNASAGTYSVIVTDQNNCSVELNNLVLNEPTELDFSATIQPVSCSGATDGSISVEISGAVPPYDFSWPDLDLNSLFVDNLPLGDYAFQVIDDNNCIYTDIFTVSTPNPIVISDDVTNISCFEANDGAIDISVTGGVPPYTYQWSNFDVNQDLSSLEPGEYEITVTDSEGCFETETYQIIEPDLLTVTALITDVACFGENTGSVVTNIEGGTPPFNESWSGGANPNNMFAATYELTITDFNGCLFTLPGVTINQPLSPLQIDAIITDVLPCNGDLTGVIEPFAEGGSEPYTFSINNNNFSGLGSGNYTVVVEDDNGCLTQEVFSINEPDPVSANLIVTDVSCFGLNDGQATVGPFGGTPPYTVIWTEFLSNELVDNTNLSPGDYSVFIEDALGCSYNEFFIVGEPLSNQLEIISNETPSCLNPFNISVESANGGTGLWSGTGPGNITFSDSMGFSTTVIVTEFGLYTISYVDGCGEEVSVNIEMNSVQPDAFATPALVYCDFQTTLQATSESNEGYWTLIDAPENTEINFVDGINSFNTEIIANGINSNNDCCYGDYLFSFTSCGSESFTSVSFEKEAPTFGVSTFQDCSLDGQIFILNPISFVDALINPGDWQCGTCLDDINNNGICDDNEWQETNDVIINYETPHEVSFTVPDYGLYDFRYFVCDTFYQKIVGFSCPLELPNVFTPNGDSQNDVFLSDDLIPGIHTNIDFLVFNRDGQIVHSQTNYDYQNTLWDGTTNESDNQQLSDGVYYYVLELFNTASKRQEYYSGYIHLFRGS
ncbi:MAG: hypothetical protein CBD51_000720 [Flavobacteriales bacterium TMED191]|nr:MAG: hypothetical protein CBD51_000720 [Flavobacteriales bacterium TMED191]